MTIKLRYKTPAVFRYSPITTDKYLTYKKERIGQIKDIEPWKTSETILVVQTSKNKAFFERMEQETGVKMIHNPIGSPKELKSSNPS